MLLVQIFLNELLVTHVTCVQNPFRMRDEMLLQFILSSERLFANVARKRLFTRMDAYVLH